VIKWRTRGQRVASKNAVLQAQNFNSRKLVTKSAQVIKTMANERQVKVIKRGQRSPSNESVTEKRTASKEDSVRIITRWIQEFREKQLQTSKRFRDTFRNPALNETT